MDFFTQSLGGVPMLLAGSIVSSIGYGYTELRSPLRMRLLVGRDTLKIQETDLPIPDIEAEAIETTGSPVPADGTKPSISRPRLVDGEAETIGEGAHRATFSIKVLQKHSSVFFTRENTRGGPALICTDHHLLP